MIPTPANLRQALTPERKKIGLFVALSFLCVGLPRVVTNATAFALFLDAFDASLLPYTYLGAAVAAPAVGMAYLWFQRRMSFWSLIILAVCFDIAILAAVRIGLQFGDAKPLIMALTVWVEVEWLIAGLVFWGLAERMFNIRDAKSLFGVIGAGEPAAVIVGGVLVAALLTIMSTKDLIAVSMLAMALSAGVIVLIRRNFAGDLHAEDGEEEEAGGLGGYGRYTKYVYVIFALTFIAEVAHFFTDNAFYGAAEEVYTDSEELASFIGLFFAGSGIVNLIFSVAVSSFVMRRYGVGFALAALPVSVGLAAIGAVITDASLGPGFAFFALVCSAKLFDEAIRNGIYATGFLTVFQPLPPGLRTRAHAAAGSYFEQVGAGVAGVGLLALSATLDFSLLAVLAALIGICALWFGVAVVQFRRYKDVLTLAFERRLFDGVMDIADDESLSAIQARLQSPNAAEVIYALTLLGANAPERLAEALPRLIAHEDAEIRREAAFVIARAHLADTRAEVLRQLETEAAPAVIGGLIRAIGAIDGAAAIEIVRPYMASTEAEIRLGAFVALMRDMAIEGLLEAGPVFLAALNAKEIDERRLAVRVLDELASPQFYRLLQDCIRSDDLIIQRLAIRTARHVNLPQLRPVLLDALLSPRTGQAALLALLPSGEAVLADAIALHGRAGLDASARIRILSLIGRIGGARALAYLCDQLATGDLDERCVAAQAAFATGLTPPDRDAVWRAIDTALADHALLTDPPDGEYAAAAVLRSSLDHAAERQRQRLLNLLALVLPRASVQAASARFRRNTPEDRAYAIEVLDTILPAGRKAPILAAFEDHHGKDAVAIADLAERALRVGSPMTAWLRTASLYALGKADASRAAELAASHMDSADARLAEVARLFRDGQSQQTLAGPTPQSTLASKGDVMLTIEKVITLRSVSIFENVPDYLLADIAERLEEIDVDTGNVLIREGEMGDRMFVVIDGRFRVSRNGRDLTDIGAGDVLGELSLLDPEPRSATVTALEPSRLFVLTQNDLDDLMAASTEIVSGFVRMLCRRLRATGERLAMTPADAPESQTTIAAVAQ